MAIVNVAQAAGGGGAPGVAGIKVRAWARVWQATRPEHSKGLRHGAWYPVVRDERADRVTIQVGEREVDVPRRILEITGSRPSRFTVVHRLGFVPGRGNDRYRLGRHYGVCPKCQWRFGIIGRPVQEKCPKCEFQGDIAWWETV
jgi:hypothetical protein